MPKNNELEKHFTASALIIGDNKVLLLLHKKLGVWLYPGGHVENNETPDQTVIREVKEETGLNVKLLGERDNNLADINVDVSALHNPYTILCELVGNHYHNDIIYLCKITGSKKIQYTEGESKEINFFSLKELDSIELFPNFRSLLKKVLKAQTKI